MWSVRRSGRLTHLELTRGGLLETVDGPEALRGLCQEPKARGSRAPEMNVVGHGPLSFTHDIKHKRNIKL